MEIKLEVTIEVDGEVVSDHEVTVKNEDAPMLVKLIEKASEMCKEQCKKELQQHIQGL